jgi:hypothetical protein
MVNSVLWLSACWVFYNAIFSGTILYFDAFSYDSLGQMITQGKFADYFLQGPSREPLYPVFVAMVMRIANVFHVSYLGMLLLIQGLVLLITQLMMARIFERIKLNDGMAAVLLFYFVISPTVLRSSLIMYSEIITYPLMLLACMACVKAWDNGFKNYQAHAILLGLSFLPLIFIKGIFELIAPLCIVFFSFGLFIKFKSKKAWVFALMALMAFAVPVNAYKMVNKIYNGQFAFTNRGSWALYGTTARRALPTTIEEDNAQRYYVLPDKTVCEAQVNKAACDHWFYAVSDTLGVNKYQDLVDQKLSPKEIDRQLVRLSIQIMWQHPFKTFNGMFWEGAKLLFWEYPSWGMVVLPRDIKMVYEQPFLQPVFLYGINGVSVLIFLSSLMLAGISFSSWLYKSSLAQTWLMMSLLLCCVYIIIHSFFFLNERNALPLTPLFLIIMGSFLTCFFSKEKHDT